VSVSLLEQLIDALRVLPGVGQKSAQRMAYHLLERQRDGGKRLGYELTPMGRALRLVLKSIRDWGLKWEQGTKEGLAAR